MKNVIVNTVAMSRAIVRGEINSRSAESKSFHNQTSYNINSYLSRELNNKIIISFKYLFKFLISLINNYIFLSLYLYLFLFYLSFEMIER